MLPLREIDGNLLVAHTPGKETMLRRAMLDGFKCIPVARELNADTDVSPALGGILLLDVCTADAATAWIPDPWRVLRRRTARVLLHRILLR